MQRISFPKKKMQNATLSEALTRGLDFHRKGNLSKAQSAYDEILRKDSRHFDAIHLSALIAKQTCRLQEAERLFLSAISVNPDVASVYSNYGTLLRELKRCDEALICYDKAIVLKPDYVEAFYNRGRALQELKRFEEALRSYNNAIALKPDYAEAFNNRGRVLQDLSRLDAALMSYDNAIALKPDYADALYNRGNTLQELNRLDEALMNYDKAIAVKPDHAEALYSRGDALRQVKRLDEALMSYDKAISLKPGNAVAFMNRGVVLGELGRYEEALMSYDKAIALTPDYAKAIINRGNALVYLNRLNEALMSYDKVIASNPHQAEAFYNRGVVLQDLNRLDEALMSYNKAIALKSDYAEAFNNSGIALQALNRLDEALMSYDKAIALKPDYADAYFNRSLLCLLNANFSIGWADYDWRKKKEKPLGNRSFSAPLLNSVSDVCKKVVLVHWEQGLGDTIQFCRYASALADLGAYVLFAPQSSLIKLISTLDPRITLVDLNGLLPPFDFHCPLMSLPSLFSTNINNIPASDSYLKASDDRIRFWREDIGSSGFKVGICWQGSAGRVDLGRSFPVSMFRDISYIQDVRLISLHKGFGEKQLDNLSAEVTVETLGKGFDSGDQAFLDTAAVMMNMDLIITSDTAVAHLAGALGVPVWVLLQYVPDWRWMVGRTDSPWYPSMRLFRQQSRGDWDGVFIDVERALKSLVSSEGESRLKNAHV